MNGTEVISLSLEKGKVWLLGLVEDMKDAPVTFPTPKGGNHPLWVLGHVILAEAGLVARFILGEENPLAKWDSLFGKDSVPEANAARYPSMDELVSEWDRVRARTLEVLGSFSDADLAKPSKAPPELAMMFGTIADCFSVISMHATFHAGQVADARRVLGRRPVFG